MKCDYCERPGHFKEVEVPDRGGGCGVANACPKCRKAKKLRLYRELYRETPPDDY